MADPVHTYIQNDNIIYFFYSLGDDWIAPENFHLFLIIKTKGIQYNLNFFLIIRL